MKPTTRPNHLEILFEDQHLVVIEKPYGMLSTPFPGSRGKSAQELLIDRYRSRGKRTIFAVHRLDRDTSGVMMFALSEKLGKRIMDDWDELVQERTYRCLCLREPGSAPLPDTAEFNDVIVYNKFGIGYIPKEHVRGGKDKTFPSTCKIQVLRRGPQSDLVEVELITGRKNQIRIQLAHRGHPISGDPNYGTIRNTKDRLALHACVLGFIHPVTGDSLRFESPEPAVFHSLVSRGKRVSPARGK